MVTVKMVGGQSAGPLDTSKGGGRAGEQRPPASAPLSPEGARRPGPGGPEIVRDSGLGLYGLVGATAGLASSAAHRASLTLLDKPAVAHGEKRRRRKPRGRVHSGVLSLCS